MTMFEALEPDGLDILVNNAGIAHASPIESLEVEDFDRLIGVHLRGTFLCTRSALRMMYGQNSGRIINTASQLALYRSSGVLPLHSRKRGDFVVYSQPGT
jgi:3-oxoacyl-[acyl-carrier protein] reductase